ncbi:MAG: VanZ family protein [Actinomycetota bacterium]|nr:VanZ family protein [Actinomycetota bacterium]
MSRLAPIYAAVGIFPLIAAGAALPYIALQYRRNGALGAGQLVLAGLFGLYLVGLAFAVVLPLRPVSPDFCQVFGVDPRLDPLSAVDDAREARASGGLRAVLRDSDVQDLPLNVLLFIPLGMFVRHLLKRGFLVTIALGASVSLAIELTQLTGNWGLYPCAYRFFSTSDLITNTIGAGIGAICAPLLGLIPGQSPPTSTAEQRLVTPGRRFLAALCNVALIAVVGFALLAVSGLLLDATRGQLFVSESLRSQALRAFALVLAPGVAIFLLIPLAWQGRTPGEWAVLLRPANTGPGSSPPVPLLLVWRFAVVQAPILLAAAAGVAGFEPAWAALGLLALVQAYLVATANRWRNGVELRLGIQITDSR